MLRSPALLGSTARCWYLVLGLVLAGLTGRATASGPFEPRRAVVVTGISQGALLAGDTTGHHVSRALAAGLALTLGPFGAHRVYLGAPPRIPLLYGLTFGGFGVLVLIDLGHILFTKDLAVYRDNEKVLMWAGGEEEVTPP